jgi:hypothetical protein
MVRLYSRKTLEKLCEVNDAREWLSDIKFAPMDTTNTLVVSSHDNAIYHYDVVIKSPAATSGTNGTGIGTTTPQPNAHSNNTDDLASQPQLTHSIPHCTLPTVHHHSH